MTAPSSDETREFLRAFRGFLEWVHSDVEDRRHPVTVLLRDHLGEDAGSHSVVASALPLFEHVNLQGALEAWAAEPGREVRVQGLAVPPHYGGLSLSNLVHGGGLPPVSLSAPDMADLPSGPGRTRGCWTLAVLLVTDARGRSALLVRRGDPRQGEEDLSVEVAGLPAVQAQEVLREIADLRDRLNVYRGQVVELRPGPAGVTFAFAELEPTGRDDVVLPEETLRRIERHTLDVARQRDRLRAAGRHLKRGLLLYGPPGTGKTHTTRYLSQSLPGTTVLLLSGRSLGLVGAVTDLARQLQPSVVVLEDVDLVAEDREFGSGSSPVLFELLDAMDGSAADADLLFLLTTNRADLLEPALAARPGRVDVAVEIGLPDADARRRLLEVHGRGLTLDLTEDDVRQAVERTDGVTASFLKELLRRAVLEALDGTSDDGSPTVTGAHLVRALDDLLDAGQSVTRALLGVPADQSGPPASAPPMPDFWPGGRMARGIAFGSVGSVGMVEGYVDDHVEYD